MTSQNTTDSSQSSEPLSEEATTANEDALREALETQAGITRLGRMVPTRSMKQSMDREERMIEAEDKALHRELHGEKDLPQRGGKDEPVDIMAARDVIVTVNEPPAATSAAQEPTPPAAESPAKTLLEKAAPLLLAAAIGAPPLAGLATYFLTRPESTPTPAASSPAPGYEYTGRAYTPGQP